MSFSPRSFFMNFSVLYLVMCRNNQDELTKSSLLDLLGCESESEKKFYYDFHQNVCQGGRRRDPGIDTEPAEEVLEGRKQIDERVVTSADVFDRLWDLDVTMIFRLDRRENIRQVGLQFQQILHLQAGMAVECRLERRNLDEWVRMY